ncbi:MAG: hypothetical protein NZ701_00265 [Roseiflexus sp.]|nr:hypothetical protein [Roseiflexus sp.]
MHLTPRKGAAALRPTLAAPYLTPAPPRHRKGAAARRPYSHVPPWRRCATVRAQRRCAPAAASHPGDALPYSGGAVPP